MTEKRYKATYNKVQIGWIEIDDTDKITNYDMDGRVIDHFAPIIREMGLENRAD